MTIRAKEHRWLLSSRDIWRAPSCQHCTDLAMAVATHDPVALSKVSGHKPDLSKVLAIIQGNDFEKMLVAELRDNIPDGEFVILEDFSPVEKTIEVLESRPIAIAQAGLEKSYGSVTLVGYADLLIRDDFELAIAQDGTLTLVSSGREFTGYTVWDIKHNSNVKDEHLFQVGGYIECLDALGSLSRTGTSGIITRFKNAVGHSAADLIQAFGEASSAMFEYLNSVSPDEFRLSREFVYECATSSVCDKVKCEYPSLCEQERYNRDDIGQLYNLDYRHRPKLEAAGFTTVASIAKADLSQAAGVIPSEQFLKYQPWAKVRNESRELGGLRMKTLVDPAEFRKLLPAKDEGDLFIDYEWFLPTGESTELVYMLSATDWNEQFFPFVAKTKEEEVEAFKGFVAFLVERSKQYPNAHFYHFHNPETKKLEDLVKRHGILQQEVAQVIERMFDIKKHVVDGRMVNSLGKLGIKQLGKFYLSDHEAGGWPGTDDSVEDGLDSMLFFYNYLAARQAGDIAKAESIMNNILEYNRADCTATSRLYNWLHEGQFS